MSERRVVTLKDVVRDPEVVVLIREADKQLETLGYTEHGERHCRLVAKNARQVLTELDCDPRAAELAAISGYLHDIGNAVNRGQHERTSALLAREVLIRMGMGYGEVVRVMGAVGNHHEDGGHPVSEVSAALILADKADVHRSRVRNPAFVKFDIHDRVNYAVRSSTLSVDKQERTITFRLRVDTSIAPVMEYFEIFMSRMVISRRAADYLHCRYALIVNGSRMI
ncbi:MAG: HD domain-containing protein [bacterium]